MNKFLSILFLMCFSINVFAVNPTQGPLQQDPSLCHYGYNHNCNTSQSSPKKIIRYTTVNIPSKYGALAFDPKTNVIGSAHNADSLEAAKKEALLKCSNNGTNQSCKIITWVRNGCIAAAGGKKGKRWVIYKAAEERGESQQIAMERCKTNGLTNCQVLVPESCSIP